MKNNKGRIKYFKIKSSVHKKPKMMNNSSSQKSFNSKYMANSGIRDPYNFVKGNYSKKSTSDLHKNMGSVPMKVDCKFFIN